MKKFASTKQMCLSMQFLFPNLVIAILYHCVFKYVLVFSPDETLEQGRNASQLLIRTVYYKNKLYR